MAWRPLAVALAVAVTLVAVPAEAAHMTQYANNPVEHDDQGRSNEPDGARSALYGSGVADCTIDVNDDGACDAADLARWPPGQVIAQGCLDSAGRRPSGLCALQQGIGTGVPLPRPGPDSHNPCPLPYGRPHRMLDVRQTSFATIGAAPLGHPIFEVNRKLQDTSFFAAERQVLGGNGNDGLYGATGLLAWYGVFVDKNCNGVIDQWGGTQSDPRNEFTWIGSCKDFSGQVRVPPDVCRVEATEFLGWVLPGAHHPNLGSPAVCAFFCVFTPADYPGALALCEVGNRLPRDPLFLGTYDCTDEDAAGRGDPLLGTGNGQRPDFYFYDGYTGSPDLNTRTYVAANNWPMYHYDSGLLTTTVIVGAVNPPEVEKDEVYRVDQATFVDVDRFQSRSPHLEGLLNGVVKPAARSTWALLRDQLP